MTGPNATGALKITDNDTRGIDTMPGPDMVANTVIEVTDCSYLIVSLYKWATAAEATGYYVGRTVSHVGTVGGVDATSSFESGPDTD